MEGGESERGLSLPYLPVILGRQHLPPLIQDPPVSVWDERGLAIVSGLAWCRPEWLVRSRGLLTG